MPSRPVPYTGGDVKKSGEFGKMYGVGDHPSVASPKPPSRLPSSSQTNSGSSRSGSSSGQLGSKSDSSGPLIKKSSSSSFSGHMTPIQPTGLITSVPLGSSSSNRRSGQLDTPSAPSSFHKNMYGAAVTSLGEEEVKLEYKLSRVAVWVFLVVLVIGLVVGAFLLAAVKNAVVLVAAVALIVPAVVIIIWNFAYRKQGVLQFLRKHPDAELRGVVDGQYVKITGKYAADFYVSGFNSGLRGLVKAGYGAKVAPFVKSTTVVDVTKNDKDLSPNFLSWLSARGLSGDGRVMCLKEGCVKEGSTVSVMGIIRCHDNVVMIVPPTEPISTGCPWPCCLFPTYIEGLILKSDESQNGAAIPV